MSPFIHLETFGAVQANMFRQLIEIIVLPVHRVEVGVTIKPLQLQRTQLELFINTSLIFHDDNTLFSVCYYQL
jgi:hypothetical protein